MSLKPTNKKRLQKVRTLLKGRWAWMKDSSVSGHDLSSGEMMTSAETHIDALEETDRLGSIINIEALQSIMDDFYQLTGMVTAILDMNGRVIEATGWQDICTKFHRIHPKTAQNCTESDLYLAKHIKPGEYIDYQCKNGLWDVVTPLYIGKRHVGNIYTGQFFYDDDVVDEKRFIQQAERYGFDKDAYMDAFHRIPRYSRDEIVHLMQFLVKFASYISAVSYAKKTLEQEIHDRKQAEAALEDQKRRLDYILQGTNVGTWEWNVQTGETIFNAHWAAIIGYSLEEISPTSIDTWLQFCHPDDLTESTRLLQLCFDRASEYYHYECRMRHKDGSWIWVLDRGKVATWTKEGKPEWMFGTHQDITKRKRAEEERENLQAQLTQAQKMESVGRLAGGVAHDFNNMLSVILGNTEMMLDDFDASNPVHKQFNEIHKAATRSADLTRQLLAFARKQTIAPKVIDLNETVEGMSKMIMRLIGENIHLSWVPGAGLWPVKVDPSQVDQVLANLCVNARDAINGTGKITIETNNVVFDEEYCRDHKGFMPGDFVMIAVSDNGIGIDKETLDNIFEPFFTTKDFGVGTGLGLSTVYGIVKQNNGFINVYSEVNQGTTFRIYLPRDVQNKVRAQRKEKNGATLTGSETILLVEDETAMLKMTTIMLERLGYTVLGASGPIEAFRISRSCSERIDMLLTDVVMPEMSGRELAETLLQTDPDIKCLYMSGYTANVIASHGILDEGVQFIHKPFTKQDLATKIREVLDHVQSTTQ